MTDHDLPVFLETWRGLQRVFPLRGEKAEIADVQAAYLKAFRRFTLEQVIAGAERCLQQQKHFPKPAEWIDAMPRAESVATELPALTEPEAHEWLRAERLRFEDTPCRCSECQAHGVAESPRRFVPLFDNNDRAMQGRIGDRIVTRGAWIHGAALMRWYLAREEFYTKARQAGHPTLTTVGR